MCLCGFLIVKYMSKGPYYGNPPPENGRVALTFDSGVAIDLVNSDDSSWWEGRLNGNQGFFPAALVEPTRLVSC